MQTLRKNWLPLLVIAIGFSASLALALAPFEFLLRNLLQDDSFYYFQIARNIAHGIGSTFDGVNMTNGYHPLWLVILVPIYAYFSAPIIMDAAPIHAALVVSALCNAGIGFVLLSIVSRYTSNMWIKALALGVWFFNPFNLYTLSDGLETALSIFFIALFFLSVLRYREHRTHVSLVVAGVVGGLMMLARLDNVFYFVTFLLWLLYDQGYHTSIRNILRVGIVATIVVSPWLVFNFLTFGMLLTSSSLAYTIVNHQLIVQDHGPSLFQQFKAVIFSSDYALRQYVIPRTGAPSVFFVLAGLTAGLFLFSDRLRKSFAQRVPVEIFLAGGLVLIFIVNASIRWSVREWYFMALNFFLAVWIAWLLEKLRESGKLRTSIVVVVACLTLSLYYISWSKNLRNVWGTPELVTAALWVNDNIPKGATIGSFNAGIQGYFSTHRVVNLDGLVNNAAFEALRQKDMWSYIQSEKIQYLVDMDQYYKYRYKSFLGVDNIFDHLELLYEEPITKTHVYRVK